MGPSVAPVALVQFSKTGIFVHFPFQPDAPGLASRMTLRAGTTAHDVLTADADVELLWDMSFDGIEDAPSPRSPRSRHADGTCDG